MSKLIEADALKNVIIDAGQSSKRYKVGEFWELNCREIYEVIDNAPTVDAEPVVRCGECVYRRRCMLQHFVESNAVDGRKIDWNKWYCADGVRDDKVDAFNK